MENVQRIKQSIQLVVHQLITLTFVYNETFIYIIFVII